MRAETRFLYNFRKRVFSQWFEILLVWMWREEDGNIKNETDYYIRDLDQVIKANERLINHEKKYHVEERFSVRSFLRRLTLTIE